MITNKELKEKVAEAKKAAIEVLVHNFKLDKTINEFPKTSGFENGYFEPYTRDLMITSLGILITENTDYKDNDEYKKMINSLRRVLETLAQNQTKRGHIPSIVNEKENVGASDTTPLFILAVSFFREKTGEKHFLEEAVKKAMTWMEYQSPNDSGLIAHLHTTDWRDEQYGFHGYCLFVNTIVYCYSQLLDDHKRAEIIRKKLNSSLFKKEVPTDENQGFYEMCVFKPAENTRFGKWFDLLGNSLMILSGIASHDMAENIISYVEQNYEEMKKPKNIFSWLWLEWLWAKFKKKKKLDLPPNFFPFVNKNDREWIKNYERYELHCKPGDYLNGGIWPFICGFYVAALVAAGETELAEQKLDALTDLVKLIREPSLPTEQENLKNIPFGFNEWIKAQTGKPMGNNWQTWSAALYLYAAKCVETKKTPFFDKIRGE